MSNDVEIYDSGDLAPYSPGGDLAPITPVDDGWGAEPDYLAERPVQPLADPQVEQNFQAIATTFTNDMAGLGFVQKDIDLCIHWFRQSLTNPPTRMPAKRASYNLWQYSNDVAMNHFAVYAQQHKLSQNMIQSICYWLQEFENLQNGVGRFAGVQKPASSDPTDQLSNAEYEQVLRINENAKANTLGYLRDLWGSSFQANLRMVDNYFNSLPEREKQHLSQFSTGWIVATNTKEVILGLFNQAIGAGTLPSGGAIATEIEQHEFVMKHDRKRWNSDERLQARYRELLRMRDE